MGFSIDTYKNQSSPVRDDDLDYDAFRDQPLSEATLRCLRYMCDVENHTICYLRDLLVTPSHTDPEITTFLTMWAYEEYWHGETLAKVLAAHGIPTEYAHIRGVRLSQGWRDKVTPIVQSILANAVGSDFVAVHMSWGAINEWSTHAGYARLIDAERHPVLTELLGRIMRQESQHVAFYATQARDRLAQSRQARTLTRFSLRRFWTPVGAGVMPKADTRHLLDYLFNGVEGTRAMRRIDEKIDRLPGLAGLQLISRAAHTWGGIAAG